MKLKLLTTVWLLLLATTLYGQEVIFEDDFQTGTLGAEWTARPNVDGGENGLVDVATNNDGDSYVRLGKSSDAGGFTTNALDLSLDLTGQTDVELLFRIWEYYDENQDNANDLNEDGIYMSDDGGASFTKVFDFKPEFWCNEVWSRYPPINISKLAAQNGLNLNNQFVIRFQQHDNADFNTWDDEDGFYIDDVVVRVSPNVYSKLPVDNDFDDAVFPNHWRFAIADQTTDDPNSINPTGLERLSSDANQTNFYLELGSQCDDLFNTSAVDLLLDLEGETEVEMWLDIYDYYDEDQPNDGIFFSDNGGDTFVKVFDFQPSKWCNDTWGRYAPFDIDKLARENGLSLTNEFIIRFQQYDNANFDTWDDEDGIRIDDVLVRVPPVTYSNLPFEDDFNTGTMKDAWSWAQATETVSDTTTIIPSGRFGLSSDADRTNYWASMGHRCDGSFATNALDLHLDLSGKSQVALSFDVNDFYDENQALLEGIFFSDNGGASFEKVYEFQPENWCNVSWSNFAPFDVDALAASVGLTLTDKFIIRFQQHDNADFNTWDDEDGIRIDNVKVYEPQPNYATATATFEESFSNFDLPSAFQWAQPVSTIRQDLRVEPSYFGISSDANRTNYYIFMGNRCDGLFTTSAVDFYLDASVGSQLILSYDIWDRGEEFTPGMDAIFFSNDGGQTFTKVIDWDFTQIANAQWVTQEINITELANDVDLTLTNTFVVRFQRYDNADFDTWNDEDGIYLDNFKLENTLYPLITSFSPGIGPIGREVTLLGGNFNDSVTVAFNGLAAEVVSLVDTTTMIVRVPEGSTTGKISVTNAEGTVESKNSFVVSIADIPAPYDLVADALPGRIEVGWTDSTDDITGFELERSVNGTGNFRKIATLNENVNFYNDGDILKDTVYYYRVRAFDALGYSPYSNLGDAVGTDGGSAGPAPEAPTNFTAEAVSSSSIDLSWNDNSDSETGYQLERSTGDDTNFAPFLILPANTTSYTNGGLASGTAYFYRIAAINASGASDSLTASASTVAELTIPAAPTSLTATTSSNEDETQIDLAWQHDGADVDGFLILRATASGGPFSQVGKADSDARSFSSFGMAPNTEYFFRVIAYNAAGESSESNTASATTNDKVTGIEDNALSNSTMVYPNPASTHIQLTMDNDKIGKAQFRLINALGQEQATFELEKSDRQLEHRLSLENLPAGLYFLEFQLGEERGMKRIGKW